jgi:hypothetical protein
LFGCISLTLAVQVFALQKRYTPILFTAADGRLLKYICAIQLGGVRGFRVGQQVAAILSFETTLKVIA